MAKSPIAKERDRIRKYIKRHVEKGYSFPDFALDLIKTRSLEELRSLDKEFLLSISTYKTEDGKIISGAERQAQERSERARKGAETKRKKKYNGNNGDTDNFFDTTHIDIVRRLIDDLPDLAEGWSYKRKIWMRYELNNYKKIFHNIIYDAIAEIGVELYNSYLQEEEATVNGACIIIVHDSNGDKIEHQLDTILPMALNIGRVVGELTQQQLHDALENQFE